MTEHACIHATTGNHLSISVLTCSRQGASIYATDLGFPLLLLPWIIPDYLVGKLSTNVGFQKKKKKLSIISLNDQREKKYHLSGLGYTYCSFYAIFILNYTYLEAIKETIIFSKVKPLKSLIKSLI